MPLPAGGDLIFLHRLQQRGLGLRRRAVDFVGQDHVAEDRALEEPQLAAARAAILLDHLGAGDVGGHQVGRKLDAAKLQRQRFGQRANQQRLGQPRHADQQAMSAGEHRHQQFLDHLPLADDHPAELLGNHAIRFVQFLYGLKVVVFRHDWLLAVDGHGTKCKMKNARCKMQSAKCKTGPTGSRAPGMNEDGRSFCILHFAFFILHSPLYQFVSAGLCLLPIVPPAIPSAINSRCVAISNLP